MTKKYLVLHIKDGKMKDYYCNDRRIIKFLGTDTKPLDSYFSIDDK